MTTLKTNNGDEDEYGFFRESIDEHNLHWTSEFEGDISCIIESEHGSNYWFEIESLVRLIARTPYEEIETLIKMPNSQLAKLHPITVSYKLIQHPISNRNRLYEYNPLIQVFYDAVEPLWKYQVDPFSTDIFVGILEYLNARLRNPDFAKKLSALKSNMRRNEKAALTYIDAIFQRTQRVLVIRVDLFLEIANAGRADQLKKLKKYFKIFLNNRRNNNCFKNEVGYIWKLESGETRASHIHLFFFMDGSRVQKHEFISMKIGEYWKQISNGEGTFFSAHSKAYLDGLLEKGVGIGLGRVESHDMKKRSFLSRMVRYFFKIDQYVSVKIFKKMRVFGKGEFPTLATNPLGRPRRRQLPVDCVDHHKSI